MATVPGRAQDQVLASAVGSHRPQFLKTEQSKKAPVPVDVQRTPVLRQRISVQFDGVTLKEALAEISRKAGLPLVYSKESLPFDMSIRFRADSITVAGALSEVLIGANVDVLLSSDGRAALVGRSAAVPGERRSGGIVGQVTDSATGRAVAGAEVFLEKTDRRTTTDTAGRYRLVEINVGEYLLTVRHFGYAKQSRQVAVRENQVDTIDLILPPRAARLNELVTTATGRRRRLDIANDVTTINADSIMRTAPIRSVTDLLESRVPGLAVQRTSGAPGDPARLRLRGISSPLRGNDPIIIVDGIRVYSDQSAERSANLARSPFLTVDTVVPPRYSSVVPSPLDYIDPNTIETIEVLKGPSAATLYGQDAANGVIVITTKRGRAGPTQWNASFEQGRTQMANADYPTLYLRWGHGSISNIPVWCPITNVIPAQAVSPGPGLATGLPCRGDSVVSFQLLNDPALTVLDRGYRTAVSLQASGGTQVLRYSVTGSYANEVGLIKLPTYEAERYQALLSMAPPEWMRRPQHFMRWSVASNLQAQLGAEATLSLASSFSRGDQQKSSLQDQLGDLMSTYLDRASGTYYLGDIENVFYPVENVLRRYYERATDVASAFTNQLNFDWKPHRWLQLNADVGVNLTHRADDVFFPRGPANSTYSVDGYLQGVSDTTGYANMAQGTAVVSTINLRGVALRTLSHGFRLSVAAGVNYTGNSTNDLGSGIKNLTPGSTLEGDSILFFRPSKTSDATLGWYVEPSVGNRRLNFSSGLRFDGGGLSNVGGLSLPRFPKLGFSYLISDESWFPFKELFPSLRIRVAYGRASRQPSPSDALRLYNVPSSVLVDSQFQMVTELKTLGNTEVRPERSSEFEGGIDADVFDNRLTVGVTGYRKTTDDALMRFGVPTSVYGSGVSIIKNIGKTRNTGIDVTMGAQLVRGGWFQWHAQAWVSRRRDLVVALGPGIEPFYSVGNNDAGGQRVVAGYPLFGHWSRPILGYADANGNGAIELDEVPLGDTAVYMGNALPDYDASMSTTISLWRNMVTINAGFTYQDGLTQENRVAQRLSIFSRGSQVPGTPLSEQVATMYLKYPDAARSPGSNANWLQTTNTFRFNSLSVSLVVPTKVARHLGAQRLELSLAGSNLGLWTNYRGLDPNVNAFGTGNNVTDTGILPQPRTWQLQVRAAY